LAHFRGTFNAIVGRGIINNLDSEQSLEQINKSAVFGQVKVTADCVDKIFMRYGIIKCGDIRAQQHGMGLWIMSLSQLKVASGS